MIFLQSSFLISADYNETSKALILTMKTGRRYRYNGVPKHIYDGLVRAASKGRFYDDFIKGKFPATRY
ncbi:KTSC domain-containing protein [Acetobacter malorum]|uniref:KTSC domain-containing protein n=1 Tax=Acetobacter malorum TaxID=178901 RepID=UPI0039E7BA90